MQNFVVQPGEIAKPNTEVKCVKIRNLKDWSLFWILFSAVVMTVLIAGSVTGVWYEPNINAQAQIIEDDKPETLSSSVPATIGTMPTIPAASK